MRASTVSTDMESESAPSDRRPLTRDSISRSTRPECSGKERADSDRSSPEGLVPRGRAAGGPAYRRWGLLLAVLACGLGSLAFQAATRPAKIAVVDISAIFEAYEKKADKQRSLEARMGSFTGKLDDLKQRNDSITADLGKLDPASEIYVQKNLERYEIELLAGQLRTAELPRIQEEQIKVLTEIREEISAEIAAVAKSRDIEIVLEKQVNMESDGKTPGFRWPIVHYATADFDLTQEVIRILNSKYKRKT